MHNAALAELGLAPEWTYEAIEVSPDRFEPLIREMPGEGFRGVNVTVPHKGAALAVATSPSEAAREIGAANTLTFVDGQVLADNTDAPGLLDAIGRTPSGMRALVLGAGGAARAVVWALSREGAAVEVWNRTPLRSGNLCAEIGGTPVSDPDESAYDLIVNATSVGLDGEDPFAELPLRPGGFAEGQIVIDMVYGPEPSRILAAAAGAGAETIDGIEVLVRQGALSLRAWTGLDPPLETMRAAARG